MVQQRLRWVLFKDGGVLGLPIRVSVVALRVGINNLPVASRTSVCAVLNIQDSMIMTRKMTCLGSHGKESALAIPATSHCAFKLSTTKRSR